MGGGIWALVSRLVIRFQAQAAARRIGGLAAVAGVAITLNDLRQAAIVEAPQSDPAAINEAALMAARLLGLTGDEILWPTHGPRHAQAGEPVTPNYLVVDFRRGRGWFLEQYTSRKAVRMAMRRGRGRGFRSGQNFGLRQTQAYARG